MSQERSRQSKTVTFVRRLLRNNGSKRLLPCLQGLSRNNPTSVQPEFNPTVGSRRKGFELTEKGEVDVHTLGLQDREQTWCRRMEVRGTGLGQWYNSCITSVGLSVGSQVDFSRKGESGAERETRDGRRWREMWPPCPTESQSEVFGSTKLTSLSFGTTDRDQTEPLLPETSVHLRSMAFREIPLERDPERIRDGSSSIFFVILLWYRSVHTRYIQSRTKKLYQILICFCQ